MPTRCTGRCCRRSTRRPWRERRFSRGSLARSRRRGGRRVLPFRRRAAAAAQPDLARQPGAALPRPVGAGGGADHDPVRRVPFDSLSRRARDRQGHQPARREPPGARGDRRRAPCSPRRQLRRQLRVSSPVGANRRGHPVRLAADAVRARPGALAVLLRALHVGPHHLEAHLGHRRAERAPGNRAHVGDHFADLGRRNLRDPHPSRRAARARGAGRDADRGGADVLVPRQLREVLPRCETRDRARHRALRRIVRRHPRGARVPPRAAQPGDLRRRQRPLSRCQHLVEPAGLHLRACHQPARAVDNCVGPAVRRVHGRAGPAHAGRADSVRALPAPVLRPDAGAVAVLQRLPGGWRSAGEAGRSRRGVAYRAGAGRPDPVGRGGGCDRVRACHVRLSREAGAARHRPARAGGPDRGDRRRDGRGQVHHGALDRAVLRPDRRAGHIGRRRPAVDRGGRPPPRDRRGHTGELSVLGNGGRQHPVRPSRRDARGDGDGRTRDRRARFHRRDAERIRHGRQAPGRSALVRPAPAGGVCARLSCGPAGAHSR